MKKLFLLLVFTFPLFCFSQFGGKGSVRPLIISISKQQAKKLKNDREGDKKENFEKIELPTESEGDFSVTIVNPYDKKISFAYSTSNLMRAVEMEPHSFWSGIANDQWQNVIIFTEDKQVSYSLKTDNCYAIYWKKNNKFWDIKPMKCDMYKN